MVGPNADTVTQSGGGVMPPPHLIERIDNKMAEFATAATSTVAIGQNVLFTEVIDCSKNNNIIHRAGSGIITLRGSTNPYSPAKYRVTFSGNIAVATGGTVGPISTAIALSGEPLYASTSTVTPAAIGDFFNVATSAVIYVPCGCCYTVAVENASETDTAIDVANANIIVTREC